MSPTYKSQTPKDSASKDRDSQNTSPKNRGLDSAYYFKQLPTGIQKSFSTEQAREVKKVIARAIRIPSKKLISIEITFWFFKRFYWVFYLGEDKRKLIRCSESDNLNLVKALTSVLFSLLIWGATLFLFITAVYYAKSTIGINLFPDEHAVDVIKQAVE